jgi:hypothetical protein
MTVAQARRFIAGVRDPMACVPEGRLNSGVGDRSSSRKFAQEDAKITKGI